MIILMTLAVVNLRSTQANARDEKRKTDVENIARGLEQRYVQGNTVATTVPWETKGSYPGMNESLHALGYDRAGFVPSTVVGGYLLDELPGTTKSGLYAPGVDQSSSSSWVMMCVWACQPAGTPAVVDSVTTIDTYVYEPVDRNGNICCCGDCVKFNMYYRTEVDNVVHTVKSRNQ